MIRPRPSLAILVLLLLGAAAGADAAEAGGLLFAQSAKLVHGPGFYLNLFKFVPVLIIFLLWAWTTWWVDDDAKELNNLKFGMWNAIVFSSGVLGFILLWAIPFYPVGLILLLLAYAVPLGMYIASRNRMVSDDEKKVMTPYHFGQVFNGLFNAVGMRGPFNKKGSGEVKVGPPIEFIGKGQGENKPDPERVAEAEQSDYYMSAKELVFDAVVRRSTDIHLEPTKEQLTARYRIDGRLHAAEPFDRQTGDAVINIFKVLAAMDITERRKPQDGSFGAKLAGREIDFRVSTSGSKTGEKMVIRVLDNAVEIANLEQIGLRPKLVAEVRSIVTQPTGMFLCCGPAGSGKSTTLYACIREIDRFQRNVNTIEDPIEYRIDNVTQMEVNNKAGQTFAGTLRSVLRQDPDVIMIGEIRDQETAEIACQAATTGHMVFSTVHANDTVTALFRLLDLGVEPFMIASSLTAVLGQRLVRVLCETCKEPYKPKPEFIKKANLPADKIDVFYRPPTEVQEVLCPTCGGTGYLGRTGVFELLVVTESIRELIRENPSINAIKAEARKNGMIYLREDGLRQVIQGRTSIKELSEVVG